jgi:DNA-binding PadR family transcriptional regulator
MKDIRELYANLSTSKIRKNILMTLNKADMRQMEIAKKVKEKQPNISKALIDLEKEGLVVSLTPDKRAWKVYGITELGKQVLKFEH